MTVSTRHLSVISKKSPTGIGGNFTINPEITALLQPQVMIKFQVEKQVSSEPNRASLEMYNLSDDHAASFDFKYDPYASIFGSRVTIQGGFLESGVKQLYSGVVTQGLTTEEGPDRITRIELQNILVELEKKQVKYTAVGGKTLKADAILSIIKSAGGIIQSGQEAAIRKNLNGAIFEANENIKGTLGSVLEKFSKGLPHRIVVYWDDAGVSFDPIGKVTSGRTTKIVSEQTGLIGVPKITTHGIEYDTRLDGSYRINDPVTVISKATTRLNLAAGGPAGIERSGTTVVSKVIHSGDNRDGQFKTVVETRFIDLLIQFAT